MRDKGLLKLELTSTVIKINHGWHFIESHFLQSLHDFIYISLEFDNL